MYWLSLMYFRWLNFWRLPETAQTLRVQSERHVKRVLWVQRSWVVVILLLSLFGQLALFIFGLVLLTFISFMFLDEA